MAKGLFDAKLLSPNLVEITMKEKVYLDISITDSIDQALQELAPDRKLYQLVIALGAYLVDPEMRHAMAHGDSGVKQLAIAWVSPDKEDNQKQEAIVSQLTLPLPIRFFDDRESGLAWLRSLGAA